MPALSVDQFGDQHAPREVGVLIDSRKARGHKARGRDVVIANDRDILWHLAAAEIEGADRANSDKVAGCEDRVEFNAAFNC